MAHLHKSHAILLSNPSWAERGRRECRVTEAEYTGELLRSSCLDWSKAGKHPGSQAAAVDALRRRLLLMRASTCPPGKIEGRPHRTSSNKGWTSCAIYLWFSRTSVASICGPTSASALVRPEGPSTNMMSLFCMPVGIIPFGSRRTLLLRTAWSLLKLSVSATPLLALTTTTRTTVCRARKP